MAKIEGFRVKNFKSLRDVTLGRLRRQPENQPLTPMTAVIGKNGVGKSALFDAFGFLADALKAGVEEACDARRHGGFERLRTQGETGPIEFEVYYREHSKAKLITYRVVIEADESGRPYVLHERMDEDRENNSLGSFLVLYQAQGMVWKENQGSQVDEITEGFDFSELGRLIKEGERQFKDAEFIRLEDPRKLGIATLGALKHHPRELSLFVASSRDGI